MAPGAHHSGEPRLWAVGHEHSAVMDALTAFSVHSTLSLTRRQLLANEVSPRAIAAAVHSGVIVRARRGVYCPANTPSHVMKSLRVGGLAACTTAAETYGLWVPEHRRTEVWLPSNASRLRSPHHRRIPLAHADRTMFRTHWHPLLHPAAASSWRVGAHDAVLQCLRCLPRELAVAVLDSALHTGIVGGHELTALAQRLPTRRRAWIDQASAQAGSGTETLVRLALHDAGLRVAPQVKIPGVGFVDLLVGPKIVVEVDSESWHSTEEQRAEDYRRDLALYSLGYTVIRVRYEQAMRHRAEIVAAVFAAVRATRTTGSSLRHRRSQFR